MDTHYMQRALELAELGRGSVSPNPVVGCVVVHNGTIIGEGWHRQYGGPHAEVDAVHSVSDANLGYLAQSTVYVTLEPCAHHGKTPPCADLLVAKNVRKVVVASLDTNPLVGGKGIERLRNAGIEVVVGVREAEARWQNRRFFTFTEKQRPYVVLKWAQTADGFIARGNHDSRWISNDLSRRLVHQWRGQEDAVMVGTNTAHHDNPRLNVRDWTGRNPVRIVVDRHLRLSPSLHLFDQSQDTICYNLHKDETDGAVRFVKCAEASPAEIAADLYRRKLQSVLVEGGAWLLQQWIDAGLWDEIRVFGSPQTFGAGIRAPRFGGQLLQSEDVAGDRLEVFLPA